MATRKKKVTMADIAKEVDVSIVSVSKALSGQKGVSEELRRMILEKAREIGYKLPEDMKLLYEPGGFTFGVVLAKRYLGDYESFYWKMYQEVTQKAGERRCFTIFESLTEEMTENNILPQLMLENKVDGIIMVGNPGYHYSDYLLEKATVPVVLLDFYTNEPKADCVISDGFYGGHVLTEYLLEKGHKKIAYVGTLFSTDSITDRYLGYMKALMEHNITPRPDYQMDDRDMVTGSRNNYDDYRYPEDMPTAFVCNCDLIASLVIKSLNNKGYRVPQDISVVGYDNFINPALCDVEITTYEVDIGAMAGTAVKVLINRMSGEKEAPQFHVVRGKLVEKASVASIPKKRSH